MTLAHKRLLYVEDDIDDQDFFLQAIRNSYPELRIITVENGQAAWDYLTASNENGLPDLMVLDINLTVFDGKVLMRKIKSDPALADLPVVIFTSSENPVDRQWAESIGSSLYNKPYDIGLMPGVVKNLLLYMR